MHENNPYPQEYTFEFIENPKALERQDVEEYLRDPNNVVWKPAGNLLTGDLTSSCVDGRENEPAVGTPGGDLGGLIDVVIVSAQHVMRREITAWESNQVLGWYLQTLIHHLQRDEQEVFDFLV